MHFCKFTKVHNLYLTFSLGFQNKFMGKIQALKALQLIYKDLKYYIEVSNITIFVTTSHSKSGVSGDLNSRTKEKPKLGATTYS